MTAAARPSASSGADCTRVLSTSIGLVTTVDIAGDPAGDDRVELARKRRHRRVHLGEDSEAHAIGHRVACDGLAHAREQALRALLAEHQLQALQHAVRVRRRAELRLPQHLEPLRRRHPNRTLDAAADR